MNVYTEEQYMAALEDLRARCAEIATHIGFDLISDQISVEPLTTPDTPPGIGYGPPPTLEEAKCDGRWMCIGDGPDDTPECFRLSRIANRSGGDQAFEEYMALLYPRCRWLPLDEHGLPCARQVPR